MSHDATAHAGQRPAQFLSVPLPDGLDGVELDADVQIHLRDPRVFERVAAAYDLSATFHEATEKHPWRLLTLALKVRGTAVTVFWADRENARDTAVVASRQVAA